MSSTLTDAARTFSDAFRFLGDNSSLVWSKTVEHLALSGAAIGLSLLIAIPLGTWLGHMHRGSFVAINLSNVGRALPSLAIIAFGVAVLGLGFVPTMIALVVLAAPVMLTNAYVGIEGVDPDAVDAARGMGMPARDVLLRVELPLALPLVFAGIRTAAVYVIATATLAAVAGGGGLGEIIVNRASYGTPGVVAASIAVAILALAADLSFAGLQRVMTPKGLRSAHVPAVGAPPPPMNPAVP